MLAILGYLCFVLRDLKLDVSINELFMFDDLVLAEANGYRIELGGLRPFGRFLPKAMFCLLLLLDLLVLFYYSKYPICLLKL